MSSPIDGSPMREIERYGVKIDICPTSGGIWLDKGELEKIIMMIREEGLREGGGHEARASDAYHDDAYHEEDAYPTRRKSHGQRPRRRKRESIFENIMDIFE
ncbi:zf-TFIIB domain-containing protein [Tateyamaria sp. syn59]|uniref:TFIIB-type zinc ribbon-containing protein n=1 Tax=Tateyamaria sp. syn59 TaxID=2576942 RepID=UPI001CB98036|nr:zf-TFIIB domain-containing protein [Tateyamaria sp. syn59]